MLVLLAALPVLGPAAVSDPWDETEDPDGMVQGTILTLAYASSGARMSAPATAPTVKIAEYLSSHIGEKRFDGGAEGSLLLALFLFILTTALHPVPSFVFRQVLPAKAMPETRRYQP